MYIQVRQKSWKNGEDKQTTNQNLDEGKTLLQKYIFFWFFRFVFQFM